MATPVVTIENLHFTSCGPPPEITARNAASVSYYMSGSGDQFVFAVWEDGTCAVHCGDWGWKPREVDVRVAMELATAVQTGARHAQGMRPEEFTWLLSCWDGTTILRGRPQRLHAAKAQGSK